MKTKTSILVMLTLLIFGILGCERKANIASPKIYNKHGVNFLYPKNWTASKANIEQNFKNINILSPGDSLFGIQVYSKSNAMSLRKYAEYFSDEMRNEIELVTMKKSSFSDIKKTKDTLDMRGIREDSVGTLLGVKIPMIREYYMKKTKDKVAYLITHAPKEDLSKVKPGFDLILKSLKFK